MTTYAIVRNYYKKKCSKARIFRTPVMCAFALEDDEFKNLFHVSKKLAKHLLETLRPYIEPRSGTKTALPAESKILCALRYFASGFYQQNIGHELLFHFSQGTVSKSIAIVSESIVKYMGGKVSFPQRYEYADIKKAFSGVGGFPGVVGVTACYHIPISTPPENDSTASPHAFLNLKGHHSMNVLFVCDAQMKITYVNAQYPGASMDWFVWKYSKLRSILEKDQTENNPDSWLLGNSNFQPEPWLLTPIEEPSTEAEENYNMCHENTWKVLKKCIHQLKLRFKCLRHGLYHRQPATEHIINSCVILHNMCLSEDSDDSFIQNLEVQDINSDNKRCGPTEELNYFKDVYVPIDKATNQVAMSQRVHVLQNYFSSHFLI